MATHTQLLYCVQPVGKTIIILLQLYRMYALVFVVLLAQMKSMYAQSTWFHRTWTRVWRERDTHTDHNSKKATGIE